MIRMIQSTSAGHAKQYFSDTLAKADYYLNDQEINGSYRGKLASRLGIEGLATKNTFYALCENIHPYTGTPLTPRTKEERTVGYDINFHCPKSLSVLHILSKDNHILDAFQESVAETMLDIEADSKTRVRKEGRSEDRNTGEMIYVDFVHQTARPVDGNEPDPHLHAHCYVFNMTWDEEEQKLKACQFRDIKRDMPYYQSRFHKRLSDKLINLGYQIERTGSSFEIEGVPKKVIEMFSKRSDEIGRAAKEQGITDAKGLDALGARTRSAKHKDISMGELKSHWRKQIFELGDEVTKANDSVRYGKEKMSHKIQAPEQCIGHTMTHSFERASVVPERRFLANAYRHSIGDVSLTIDAINQGFDAEDRLIKVEDRGQLFCTTKDVLTEERQMVRLANAGRGKMTPLYKEVPEMNLKGQAATAVGNALMSKDRVNIIMGGAGTGKTTLMQEAVPLIEKTGKRVTVLAPSAQASRGTLRDEGFTEAETVASLLLNKERQEQLDGQVIYVDEAGLLGTKEMYDVIKLATDKNALLILSGDTRQHTAVTRGDALRILNTVAGIRASNVSKIYRQKDEQYKKAVEDLSTGNIKSGFEKLDAIGSIKKVDKMKPNEELVDDFIKFSKKGKTVLVISPTHKQGEEVTEAIRQRMRQAGLLGKKELKIDKLSNLNFTAAEKKDWRNFKPKQIVQFNQNMPGIKRGSAWEVSEISKDEIFITDSIGICKKLPKEKPEHYDVYHHSEIGVSKGDKVRITKIAFDKDKHRLNNGEVFDVVKIKKEGEVTLRNAKSKATYNIKKDFGHITHAHCVTSHNSQGKTVDYCLISQPAATFSATNAKQFYVSVSRAREATNVYTDDKEELLEAASRLGDRTSAMELVSSQTHHSDYVQHLERTTNYEKQKETPPNPMPKNHLEKEEYEPEL